MDYWLYSLKDGRRFSPDYLLIINDVVNKQMYYQVIIEPKGGHLLEQDNWKEEA
jgi:type III restriction enzyme